MHWEGMIKSANSQYGASLWKGVISAKEIEDYLHCLGDFSGFLHTDYKPVGSCGQYYGNLIKGW